MKLPTYSKHLLVLAAPIWAVALHCSAQTITPATAPPPQSTVAAPQDLHATGTLSSFDAKGLTVQDPVTGSMTVYNTGVDTTFVDTHDKFVAPDSVTLQTPVKVHYVSVGNQLLARKVVVNTTLNTDGTLVELSPGVLVIQLTAPAAPLRFVSNNTLKFVDPKGHPVPPDSVAPGAPVRVFYMKSGDALLASKVEMLGVGAAGSSTTSVTTRTTTTTTSQENKR